MIMSTRRAMLAAFALTLAASGTALAEPPSAAPEPAPAPSARLAATDVQSTMAKQLATAYGAIHGRRTYIKTDRPIYRPGEVIWVQTWNLGAGDLAPKTAAALAVYRLYGPRGEHITSKNVESGQGIAWNDLDIPESAVGGEYTVQVTFPEGNTDQRVIYVSAYGKAQLLKEVEFLKASYAPGETVRAAVEFRRKSGEALAGVKLVAEARFAGQQSVRSEVKTDADGRATVSFEVPAGYKGTDAVLNVIAEDGGSRESILEAIPLTGAAVQVGLFPEGGDLVAGLPARVYFDAVRPDGEPADIWGLVVDETNHIVAELRSSLYGMGRFEFTPEAGRSYRLLVYGPPGIEDAVPLPEVKAAGCVLRSFDDVDGALTALALWWAGARRPAGLFSAGRWLAALAVAGFAIGALGWALDAHVSSFRPVAPRWPLILALLAGMAPYFLADEWLTRGRDAPPLAYPLTKLCFLGSLAAAVALDLERLFFLIILTPALLLFFLVYGLFSRWAWRRTGDPWVGALANAAAFAWAIGVTFPMVAG